MSLDPTLRALLEGWMPRQRWYPAKGRGVGLRDLGEVRLGADGDVDVTVLLVGLDSGDRLDVVQVPLTRRHAPLAGADHALVGSLDDDVWVYDAPHDPAYVAAVLAGLDRTAGRAAPPVPVTSRVLGGEQSNTSVVVDLGPATPVIVKVFRTLHGGANPDVEVLRALDGSPQVPGLVGWLGGGWTLPDGTQVTGHLAVATEFVADAQDAWREAVTAVAADEDFSDRARGLGAATATLHEAMAQALGRVVPDEDTRSALGAGLSNRVEWALRSTDALTQHAEALRAWVDRLDLGDLPPLQRVHGDYHLGQVLHSPRRGWVVLDFEGEPLRPLAERTVPDLALRDVAGMLRSFDYAAGQQRMSDPTSGARADVWAARARDAFCLGYADRSGHDPRERAGLLGALELDKALYEVVYEAGNRPAWIDVPLAAVQRLLG